MARFNIVPTLIALAAALILPAFNTQAEVRGGLYDVESKIPFNILDSVYYDAKSGQLALIGHRDNRFKAFGDFAGKPETGIHTDMDSGIKPAGRFPACARINPERE
jgi:hypothetical protein